MNLAVNSRDAMPNGGKLVITTSVRTFEAADISPEAEMAPGRYVCVTVQDDGCGIAPEQMAKIFEPFFTTKEIGKGTGLGLATVYGIVKQHKGYITAQSTVGAGASFEVLLPYVDAPPEATVAPAPVQKPTSGHGTILFVEDEVHIRELAKMFLESKGYRIIEAGNGPEAVQHWEKHRHEIDLVLTDLVMPEGLSGQQLVQRLHAERPDLKVIFSSGYSSDLFGESGILKEGSNFLQKPYRLNSLAEIVHDCLYSGEAAA